MAPFDTRGTYSGLARRRPTTSTPPGARYGSPSIALATALTDNGRAHGSCRQVLSDQAVAERAPVYAYEFAEPTGRVAEGFLHGASHGADVPYFFDSYVREAPPKPDPRAGWPRP